MAPLFIPIARADRKEWGMRNLPTRSYSMRTQDAVLNALQPIRHLLMDESINEIMINGPDDVYIKQGGHNKRADGFDLSATTINTAITILAAIVDKEVNPDQLLLSARLPGFRVECGLPPVALKGPNMCFRRHASKVMTMEGYVESGVVSQEQADCIAELLAQRKNILIAGGTFSGKTTLMNCLLSMIDPDHRLYVIEQVSELKIVSPNFVQMECDPEYGVTPKACVKHAMRYSPDRIILGELRGPEAYDWLDASNTGHPGAAATLHANSAHEGLKRLGSLVMQAANGMPFEIVHDWIGEAVDAVVFIEHHLGKRRLREIAMVQGYDRHTGQFITQLLRHPTCTPEDANAVERPTPLQIISTH